jgi:hypothetical protein
VVGALAVLQREGGLRFILCLSAIAVVLALAIGCLRGSDGLELCNSAERMVNTLRVASVAVQAQSWSFVKGPAVQALFAARRFCFALVVSHVATRATVGSGSRVTACRAHNALVAVLLESACRAFFTLELGILDMPSVAECTRTAGHPTAIRANAARQTNVAVLAGRLAGFVLIQIIFVLAANGCVATIATMTDWARLADAVLMCIGRRCFKLTKLTNGVIFTLTIGSVCWCVCLVLFIATVADIRALTIMEVASRFGFILCG